MITPTIKAAIFWSTVKKHLRFIEVKTIFSTLHLVHEQTGLLKLATLAYSNLNAGMFLVLHDCDPGLKSSGPKKYTHTYTHFHLRRHENAATICNPGVEATRQCVTWYVKLPSPRRTNTKHSKILKVCCTCFSWSAYATSLRGITRTTIPQKAYAAWCNPGFYLRTPSIWHEQMQPREGLDRAQIKPLKNCKCKSCS